MPVNQLNHVDFEKMYTRLYNFVYYFVTFRIKDKSAGEDIVQEVFLTAYRTWKEIPEDEKTAKNFLLVIAKSRIIDHYRSAHERHSFVPDAINSDDGSEYSYFEQFSSGEKLTEDILIQSENSKIALELLNSLNESDRNILTAKYLQDLSYREIAEIYEVKEDNIRKKVERALKKLKNISK